MDRSTIRPKRTAEWGKNLLVLLIWLLVWTGLSAWTGSALLLPSPLEVGKTLLGLIPTADFWHAVGLSLLRISAGCAGGIAAGTLLAAATYSSAVCRRLLSPVIRLIRATPVASFIILALLWIGRGPVPAFISALMVMPVVWGAVSGALHETDRELLEMARAFRFGARKTAKLIYAGSVCPAFRTACSTAIGLAWKSGVAAEVLCQPSGAIGARLYRAKLLMETPELFAWTAVVILLSMLLERLCRRVLTPGREVRG